MMTPSGALDTLYDFGVTALYSLIAATAATRLGLRSNFWVPIQSLCKGGDYATLVPP